jgi:hypothetical protein
VGSTFSTLSNCPSSPTGRGVTAQYTVDLPAALASNRLSRSLLSRISNVNSNEDRYLQATSLRAKGALNVYGIATKTGATAAQSALWSDFFD